eukprot:jgi/Chlat1/4734/Chrsp30S04764
MGDRRRLGGDSTMQTEAARQGGSVGGKSVCRYFAAGLYCKRGDKCQFAHSLLPASTSRNGGGASVSNGGGGGSKRGSAERGGGGGSSSRSARDGGWGSSRDRDSGSRNRRSRGRDDRGSSRRAQKLCQYWVAGDCKKGTSCAFLHAHTSTPDMEKLADLVGHDRGLRALALALTNPAAPQLYSGGQDRTVRVWDCTSGQCTSVVDVGGEVTSILVEGGWLFVGLTSEIRCWNMATGTQLSLAGHQGSIHALHVFNTLLFSAAQDATIKAWKFNPTVNSFECVATLVGHGAPVLALQGLGAYLYSASWDKTIRVWDLASGQCVQSVEAHTHVVMSLLVWEGHLLSCSLDGYIKIWGQGSSGQLDQVHVHPDDDEGEKGMEAMGGGALALCGTVDAQNKPILLCAYNDNSTRLWELPSFADRGSVYTLAEVRALGVGPAGTFFTGDSSGALKVWRWLPGPAVG